MSSRRKRVKKTAMELDITSLLDILVVILIFLLKSYSSSPDIINIPKDINLPHSYSQQANIESITLQVSQEKIYLDEVFVTNITPKLLSPKGELNIDQLEQELSKRKLEIEKQKTGSPFLGTLNLVMDKQAPYELLRKLMYTAGRAGFSQFQFVVMGQSP